jgi:hypothetical protein
MKKIPPAFFAASLLTALTAASCSLPLEPPNKVRLQSDAALAFTIPETGEENVAHYFDDIIKDSLTSQENMQFIDYAPPSPPWKDAKAYLIRYEVEPIDFTIDKVEIPEFEIAAIPLADVTVPEEIGGGVGIDFSGNLIISAGSLSPLISDVSSPALISSGDTVRRAKIKTGTLEIAAYDTSNVLVSGLNYSELNIKLDGEVNNLSSPENGKYTLDGKIITASTDGTDGTKVTVSGEIKNNTASPITLRKITITTKVTEFTEVQIQTGSTHSGEEEAEIEPDIPNGVNFVTFGKIGVKLAFSVEKNGGPDTSVTVAGLPVSLKAPLLDIDETRTLDEDSFRNGLTFIKNNHSLYTNSDDHIAYSSQYPGVKIEGTDDKVTVNVNPKTDDKYALITLKNLGPGDFAVSVQPDTIMELASVNVNLNEFIGDSDDLEGGFPGDDGGLDIASIFDGMGAMGENVNFNRLDLYLYMRGDREFLEDTTFSLAAEANTEDGASAVSKKLAEDEEFQHLTGDLPGFDSVDTVTDALVNAQFYTEELLDVVNKKPSSLQITYDIQLAEHLQIDGGGLLDEGRSIKLQPELILVMPLQFRLLAEAGKDYGSMKLTESESGADAEEQDDIFGRTGSDDEITEYLDQFKRTRLRMDYDNFMGLDGTSFYIFSRDYAGNTNWEKSVTLHEGAGQTLSLELNSGDIKTYPFRPNMEIRTQVETGKDYGLIEIKRGGEDTSGGGVRFKISVEMESRVDLAFDL